MNQLSVVVAVASTLVMMPCCHSFSPRPPPHHAFKPSPLFMGKGLNRARNKQAEMIKKMQLAKQQQNKDESSTSSTSESDEEHPAIVEQDQEEDNERMLFAELLAKNLPPVTKEQPLKRYESSKPLVGTNKNMTSNKPKVKAKDAKRKKKARQKNGDQVQQEEDEHVPLQQGDIAKRRLFESLVELSTDQKLGPAQAAQLVPWVPPFLSSYLVVVADPRRQSGDLRQALQYLTSNLPPEVLSQTIVISADSNDETESWMKRAGVETSIRIFSDTKLEWMFMYSAVVDDERWSMSLYVFDSDGIIQTHSRQVDPSKASQLVMDSVDDIYGE